MGPKERKALEIFKLHKPPSFSGTKSTVPPQDAENWVSKLEKTFLLSNTLFNYWPLFGASMFSGEARTWWTGIQNKLDVSILSWVHFLELFNTRFVEKAYRYHKLREFIKLMQAEMSVAAYKARFTSLSRYAAQLVGDGQMRAARFQDGLNLEIRSKVVPLMCTTFDEVVRAALFFEQEIHSGFQNQSTSKMKYFDTDTLGNHNGSGGKNCRDCKNNFVKNSPYGIKKITIEDRKCYACQQYGHIQTSCPMLRCLEKKYSDTDTEGNHNGSGGKNRKARKNISVKYSPYGLKKNTNKDRKCFVCQQYGHIQTSCPMLGCLNNMRSNRKCYNCRQFGHVGASCPLLSS